MINLAAEEKTKLKNIIDLQYCTGGKYKNKIEKKSLSFSIFKKLGREGHKTKNKKKIWPNCQLDQSGSIPLTNEKNALLQIYVCNLIP